ncbi:MAG: DoxX family protein [Gemmatimonadaceae bacterium]
MLYGRIITAIAVLFLAFDTAIKVLVLPPALKATVDLGYPASVVFALGAIELTCLLLYVVPRTSILGAIALTGWLGGAVATHVRAQSPLFSHTLFPLYVAALVWGGLYLRDARLRSLVAAR